MNWSALKAACTRALLLAIALQSASALAEVRLTVRAGEQLSDILPRYGVEPGTDEFILVSHDIVYRNRAAFINGNPRMLIPGMTIVLPFEGEDRIEVARSEPPAPSREPDPEPVAFDDFEDEDEPEQAEVDDGSEIVAATPQEIALIESGSGGVTIERGGEASSFGDSQMIESDTRIETAAGSVTTIRFVDGTRVELGGKTTLVIDEYPNNDADDDGIEATLRLISGAMRVVSGDRWKSREDAFRIDTPTGVLSVRGTDFVVRHCKSNCGELVGTTTGVKEGLIFLGNEAGSLILGKGEFGQVKSRRSEPRQGEMPEGFFDLAKDTSQIEADQGMLKRILTQLLAIWHYIWSQIFGD